MLGDFMVGSLFSNPPVGDCDRRRHERRRPARGSAGGIRRGGPPRCACRSRSRAPPLPATPCPPPSGGKRLSTKDKPGFEPAQTPSTHVVVIAMWIYPANFSMKDQASFEHAQAPSTHNYVDLTCLNPVSDSEKTRSSNIPFCQTPVGLGSCSMIGRALHR